MSDVPGGPGLPPPPPVSGGPSGSIPSKTLGEILSAAFDVYRANASKLLLLVAIVVVPLTLVGVLVANAIVDANDIDVRGGELVVDEIGTSFLAALFAGAIGGLIAVLISAVLQAATVRAAAQATIGDPVDVEASYRYGFRRLWSVILISILVGLIVGAGFILLIVPGIIFLVFLSASIPALIVENKRGTDALGRSWALVQGNFWHALGVIFVAALIVGIVSGIIGAIGGDNWVVRWIFTAIAQIVTAPYAALVSVLLYLDLRARRETLSATALRQELASGIEPA
ncbi:MAG TPA: hypothetical protein VFZ75_08890 [Actinomycetota bacterium]|nr:hypothetical protein [Actinomycetota bacterium]